MMSSRGMNVPFHSGQAEGVAAGLAGIGASIDWTDESKPYRSPLYAEVDDSWRPKGTKVTKDETSWTGTDVKLSKTTLHYMHTIVTETTWGPE